MPNPGGERTGKLSIVESGRGTAEMSGSGNPVGKKETLPYRIELWDAGDRGSIERVLARAFNAPLAHAIFNAVQNEHPGRRVVLRRGSRIIADSAE